MKIFSKNFNLKKGQTNLSGFSDLSCPVFSLLQSVLCCPVQTLIFCHGNKLVPDLRRTEIFLELELEQIIFQTRTKTSELFELERRTRTPS